MSEWISYSKIDILIGKTIKSIDQKEDSILFETSDSEFYKMYHDQSCCEEVVIESVCGDLDWLLDSPVLLAEERTSNQNPIESKDMYGDDTSFTWTFYEIATIKGSVTIRWYGSSNGYYSEAVSFDRVSWGKQDESTGERGT